MSDRGTHFKNDVMKVLREQNRASHRFTLAYAPWSNGTVEVVNREVLRVLRALCSEMRIAFKEWPNILPIVQGALNSAAKIGGFGATYSDDEFACRRAARLGGDFD